MALGLTENLTVTAYNGPGGNKLELLVDGQAPLQIHSVIEGKLQSDSGKFGKKLVVAIPENLQQPAPGAYATLTDFKTVVKGTGSKKRPFIGLSGCTKKTLNYKTDFVFTDGTTSTATTHVEVQLAPTEHHEAPRKGPSCMSGRALFCCVHRRFATRIPGTSQVQMLMAEPELEATLPGHATGRGGLRRAVGDVARRAGLPGRGRRSPPGRVGGRQQRRHPCLPRARGRPSAPIARVEDGELHLVIADRGRRPVAADRQPRARPRAADHGADQRALRDRQRPRGDRDPPRVPVPADRLTPAGPERRRPERPGRRRA